MTEELDRKDRVSIYKIFQQIRSSCGWKSWDEFLQWAIDNGWHRDCQLLKRDDTKRHGPKNSYFNGEAVQQEKPVVRPGSDSRFCAGCQRICPSDGRGCSEWREWYTKDWDSNIHVPASEPEYKGRMKFRYEHPDLIREGIIDG